MEKVKRQVYTAGVHLRESGDGEDSRTIEGYAIVFGERSVLLMEGWRTCYEVIEAGAVDKALLDSQDIKLTMFHDRQLILGRSNKGAGTLSYEIDEKGVKFVCDMPHTADGDKALELVKRGDIAGCSFMYSTNERDSENCVSYAELDEKDDWGDPIYLRTVKKILGVYDFTLAADPAYEQTEVSQREVEGNASFDALVKAKHSQSEDKKREEAEAEAKKKAEAEAEAERKREANRKANVKALRSLASNIFK